MMRFDVSNLHKKLFEHSIKLITSFNIFTLDMDSNSIVFTENADEVRKELVRNYQIIPSWISFSTGFECLMKSLLLKHDSLTINKGNVSNRSNVLMENASNISVVQNVYIFVENTEIEAKQSPTMSSTLSQKGITKLHDLNTGSLGESIGSLKKLVTKGIISQDQRECLHNAAFTLLDIRRNVDAHTFYGLIVGGSINGDLENVYLPAVNFMISKY